MFKKEGRDERTGRHKWSGIRMQNLEQVDIIQKRNMFKKLDGTDGRTGRTDRTGRHISGITIHNSQKVDII